MTSPKNRLIRLLDRGFYAAELPPSFRTKRFSSVISSLLPNTNYFGSTTFFDGATFRGHLRTFGVINPISYFALSKFIADNWADISNISKLSTSSGSRPKFPPLLHGGRAIETASIASKRKSQRHLASSYPVMLGMDINRFYGSIYTHSIPWAALGKKTAKQMHHAKTLSAHWSSTLDKLARNCNQQQTIGLPIGPDTSRIISEMILARIDNVLLGNNGLTSSQIYHNIDDYQIGCLDTSATEKAQSAFVRTISQFELRLNDFKTSVDQGIDFRPSNFQRHFDPISELTGTAFIECFFENLYTQAREHPNTNVVGYALKRFARKIARTTEKDLAREYLQRMIFAMPHQARWILPLLLGFYSAGSGSSHARRIISWGAETSARRNDVGSLLWYLYGALFLKIKLSADLCEQCFGMSNELVDLVLVHGKKETIFPVSIKNFRSRYAESDLKTPAWLPIYEIHRRSWDTSSAFAKIGTPDDQDGYYNTLRLSQVEFYSTDEQNYEMSAFSDWHIGMNDFEIEEDQIDWDSYGFGDNDENWEDSEY